MGYTSVWKVLDEMIADFRQRGAVVPSEIVSDLKTAKTIIKIVQTNTECGENLQKIEQYLGNVQIYLVSDGQRRFGQKYADEWLAHIDEASRKASDVEEDEERFVPGLPRQRSWIKIAASAELPLEKVRNLARNSGLSYEEQSQNNVLIHGEKEKIKNFVKKIAAEHKPKAGKRR
jgi:hypothetical protein